VTELSTCALAGFYPWLADLALGQDTIVVRHYGPSDTHAPPWQAA
jgi:hypothetical protein